MGSLGLPPADGNSNRLFVFAQDEQGEMPINDPNLQHETPGGRKPKFGRATMLLLACGAVFVAGLFIFFVVYGAANSVAH